MNTILRICQKSLTLNGLKKLDIKKTREYLPAKFLVEDKWNTSC